VSLFLVGNGDDDERIETTTQPLILYRYAHAGRDDTTISQLGEAKKSDLGREFAKRSASVLWVGQKRAAA